MFGLDAAIQKKSLLLTRLVDALPLISTKETSAIDFQGEFARLIPGVNSAVNSNAFIDDFESARNIFSLNTQANSWRPGSVPKTIVPITSLTQRKAILIVQRFQLIPSITVCMEQVVWKQVVWDQLARRSKLCLRTCSFVSSLIS
jgi:hypothetical protein